MIKPCHFAFNDCVEKAQGNVNLRDLPRVKRSFLCDLAVYTDAPVNHLSSIVLPFHLYLDKKTNTSGFAIESCAFLFQLCSFVIYS